VQTVLSLWDDDVVHVPDATFDFQCTRAPGTGDNCKAQNASTPVFGRHCDFRNSTLMMHQVLGNAAECQQACCGTVGCTCWTWSPPPAYNEGCWMFNSSVPNIPMPNLTTGWVHHNPDAPSPPPPFMPTGYAFRNTSVAGGGITYVVLVDATVMLDTDRVTSCNVTVTTSDPSTVPHPTIPGESRRPHTGDALRILLSNGRFLGRCSAGTV